MAIRSRSSRSRSRSWTRRSPCHSTSGSAAQAEGRALALLDRAAELGGGFALLWHTNRFDPPTAAGWDRLYERILDGVLERGGVCLTAGELAAEAGEILWLLRLVALG